MSLVKAAAVIHRTGSGPGSGRLSIAARSTAQSSCRRPVLVGGNQQFGTLHVGRMQPSHRSNNMNSGMRRTFEMNHTTPTTLVSRQLVIMNINQLHHQFQPFRHSIRGFTVSARTADSAPLPPPVAPSELPTEVEPLVGTAPFYTRHLLICTGQEGREWVPRPELSDPYLNLLTNAVKAQHIKVNLTDEASLLQGAHHDDDGDDKIHTLSNQTPSLSSVSSLLSSSRQHGSKEVEGPRHDLILYPDQVKFLNVKFQAFKDLAKYLQKYPVGQLGKQLEETTTVVTDETATIDVRTVANAKLDASSLDQQELMASMVGTGQQQPGDQVDLHRLGLDIPEDKDVMETQTQAHVTTIELRPGGESVQAQKLTQSASILVCTHGKRDCRCGDQGGELYRILQETVQKTGLDRSIKVLGISHIGGHKYAPNTITYPSGDWHARLSERDSIDAQQLIFGALDPFGSDPLWDNWRGRMGLNQQRQQAMFDTAMKHREEEHHHNNSNDGDGHPETLFSAPGQELWSESKHEEPEQQQQKPSESSPPPSKSIDSSVTPPKTVRVIFETFQKVQHRVTANVGDRIFDLVQDPKYLALETHGANADSETLAAHQAVHKCLECTCGGMIECATCHVYIEPPFHERLPEASENEEDMLEYAVGRKENISRLGCQIRIREELEGMVIKLPQY